jgi:hypothetical protein
MRHKTPGANVHASNNLLQGQSGTSRVPVALNVA